MWRQRQQRLIAYLPVRVRACVSLLSSPARGHGPHLMRCERLGLHVPPLVEEGHTVVW